MALVADVAGDRTSKGALDAGEQRESELVVDDGVAELTLGDGVRVSLPVGDEAAVAESDNGDQVVVAEDETAFAALEKDDSSVQVVFSIVDADEPVDFPFVVEPVAGARWVLLDGGGALYLDRQGGIVVGAVTPWAVDAAGAAVPTRFEVRGDSLVQVVDHRRAGVTYPVVADPWLGSDLFSKVTRDTYNGDLRINATKSTWGNAMHLPNASSWAIFFTAGWNEVKAKQPRVTEKATLKQQYECHVAGGYFNIAGTWNLEKFRPNRTAAAGWGWRVETHRCNWTTASGT